MTEKILIFGVDDSILKAKLERALLPVKVRIKFVADCDNTKTLGELAGMEIKDSVVSADGNIDGVMFVFAFFADKKLNQALSAIKKVGSFPYKAVLTPANQGWPAVKCFREIKAEHEKMTAKS